MSDIDLLLDLSYNLIKANQESVKAFRTDMRYTWEKIDQRLEAQERALEFFKLQLDKLSKFTKDKGIQ